jgi:natural product biosynthesis luciferase-like monooxygenase protein
VKFGHFALPTYYEDVYGPLADFVPRWLDFLVSSEALGFDSLWANEHHFGPFGGLVPNPLILLASFAQRTRHVRLGTSVVVLPLHDPLYVAEQLAQVDVLSGGRVELGVGQGLAPHDYAVRGIPLEEARERTREGLEVIVKAWSGRPFRHEGRFYHYPEVECWPKPTSPELGIWVACSRNPESFTWTAEHGFHLLTVAYTNPIADFAPLPRLHREQWLRSGRDPAAYRHANHYQVVLGRDGAEARATAQRGLERYIQQLVEAGARPAFTRVDIDQLVREDRIVAGTPAEAAAMLQRAQAVLGATSIDCTFCFGGIPLERAAESMRLFAEEVIPALAPLQLAI